MKYIYNKFINFVFQMAQNVHRILLPKTARDKTTLDRSKNDDTIK